MPVALRETSMQRAADNGWPAFIPAFTPPIPASNDPFGQLTHYFTRYRDALLNAGHSDEVVNHCLSWTTHTAVRPYRPHRRAGPRRDAADHGLVPAGHRPGI